MVWKGAHLEPNMKAIFPFYDYYVNVKKYGREVGSERAPLEPNIQARFPFCVYYVDLKKYGRELRLERTPPLELNVEAIFPFYNVEKYGREPRSASALP